MYRMDTCASLFIAALLLTIPNCGTDMDIYQQRNGQRKYGTHTQ